MSIRPIDNSVLLPKTQEMSGVKQAEISKGENITHSNFVERDKNVIHNQQKVVDTKETEYNRIGQEESNEKSKYSGKRRKKEDSEKDNEGEEDKKYNKIRGMNVDVRI